MVEVIIPFAGSCEHRLQALEWVRGRYRWPVRVAEIVAGEWSKGRAVNPAIEESAADVVVVADADVWSPETTEAVSAVVDGSPWAIPHRGVFRLTEEATGAVLAGEEPDREMELCQRPYLGYEGGGVLVARREVLLEVPLDSRFIGWGSEDESWGAALRCLIGAPWRGKAPLYHLWHPPQQRISRRRGSEASWRLLQRYRGVASDPAAMRRLVDEYRQPAHSHGHAEAA